MSRDSKEILQKSGLLIVVSGRSGAGKDSVTEKLRETPELSHLSFTQVITTASRERRESEVHGREYYFSKLETMQEMEMRGEFIEPLTQTGGPNDWKATEKKELLAVLQEGKNVIWRIDLSRAADVAKGGYFHNYMDKSTADALELNTIVVLIDVDPDIDLMEIRKKRDGQKFNINSYIDRDLQEAEILKRHGHHFKNKIVNRWNALENTTQEVSSLILNFIQSK